MTNLWNRLTPRRKSLLVTALVALTTLAAGYGVARLGTQGNSADAASADCEDVLYWYDPMVPGQHFDKPGKSPFMDMQLVPKCAGEEASAVVRIDPGLIQNFGIRTSTAEYGILEPEITVTGVLAYNGRDVAIVQPRAGGYVQRTYGRAPDDVVARGAPIADILVPEWGGAQEEYLAVARTGNSELAAAARERMRLQGMPESLISSVAQRTPSFHYYGYSSYQRCNHRVGSALGNDGRLGPDAGRDQRVLTHLARGRCSGGAG